MDPGSGYGRFGNAPVDGSHTALDYVLSRLTRLPALRSDKNALMSEQELISQRHKSWWSIQLLKDKVRMQLPHLSQPNHETKNIDTIRAINEEIEERIKIHEDHL